tara:strand:- start:251 stop:577 length:327 start_codon:yes stop_codon:yes gene_type:complete
MDKLKELKSKHMSKMPVGAPPGGLPKGLPGGLPDGMPGGESDGNAASFGEIVIFAITQALKFIILLLGIFLFIIMLPIVPFLWVSYKGFHGKYGIIKLFRENFNVYQL